jgi:hypothetical protein
MWRAHVVDVMNPMGALVAQRVLHCQSVFVHASARDALFFAAWKHAIEPGAHISLGFNPRMVLLENLERIVRIALQLMNHPMNKNDDVFIGSIGDPKIRPKSHILTPGELPLEVRLREEVLYFFGTLTAVGSKLQLSERIKTFEYLAAVVGQNDEILPMAVEENLGHELRSVFEFLNSLHYIQSNARQTGRIKRLCEVEKKLQDICCAASLSEHAKGQSTPLKWDVKTGGDDARDDSAVVIFPSASVLGQTQEEMRRLIAEHLTRGQNEYLLVDSFHHRLRWMERLNRTRQQEIFFEIKKDPLRARSNFESRSGRTRIAVLSKKTIQYLLSLKSTAVFRVLPIGVQEIVDTAMEIYEIREHEGWGEPPGFDFVDLVEALAVLGFEINSGQILQSLTDQVVPRFFDATLRQQSIDSDQCYRMLSD